jgi:hypothetical protein
MDPVELARRLRAIRELERNLIYSDVIGPGLKKMESEMLAGLSDRNSDPEKRSTYLEGYLKASSLGNMLAQEKARLESERSEFEKKTGEAFDESDDNDA